MENADTSKDIMTTAMEMEQKVADFYLNVAKNTTNPDIRETFLQLTAAEQSHAGFFLSLVESSPLLADPTPDTESIAMSEALSVARLLNKMKTTDIRAVRDILEIAIELESNTVVFYTAMKELVPVAASKRGFDHIIKEEVKHGIILSETLERFDDSAASV